ncbi:hypothetical protein CCMA1212_003252 [Trichoderma ghanense]|uniref:ATPase AAA-type core domain-containing protein n=1 Tax=Trichoderma ghanense TaxID=65468 RepID=A0ABY2HDA4_9HYPO
MGFRPFDSGSDTSFDSDADSLNQESAAKRTDKDLIPSFVQNHKSHQAISATLLILILLRPLNYQRPPTPIEDVIVGNVQGLIILLSSPPETGKTPIAEAVADRTHRPPFYLQVEDHGINAASLGASIKRVFDMAPEWNAVIRLDEADVFMAERNPNNSHRNELVSIFLRELECFQGLLALSVSRLPEQKGLEASLRERDDVPTLGAEIDTETYVNTRAPLGDAEIGRLSLLQLNGREIKNAVRMVKSWCDHKGYAMTLVRWERGSKATNPHAAKECGIDRDLYE